MHLYKISIYMQFDFSSISEPWFNCIVTLFSDFSSPVFWAVTGQRESGKERREILIYSEEIHGGKWLIYVAEGNYVLVSFSLGLQKEFDLKQRWHWSVMISLIQQSFVIHMHSPRDIYLWKTFIVLNLIPCLNPHQRLTWCSCYQTLGLCQCFVFRTINML